MRINLKSQQQVLLFTIVLFLLGGFLLLPFYRYQINPDATSYISIAQKYANGDIRHAVNGFWGPGLSWIMAIFIKFGVNDYLLLAKIIALSTCSIILVIINSLFNAFSTPPLKRLILFLPLIPVLWKWALPEPITGDLLFAASLCFLVLRNIKFMREPNLTNSLLSGLAGAFLYASKPIGFYAALANYLLLTLVLSQRKSKQKLGIANKFKKPIMIIVSTFILLSAPWVIVLSLKYHQPLVATSTTINRALVGPKHPQAPLLYALIKTPNPTATSSWEDPFDYNIENWNILGSISNFFFFIGLVISNLYTATVSFNTICVVGTGILAFLLIYRGLNFQSRKNDSRDLDFILLTALLVVFAYSTILILDRYIFGPMILFLLLGTIWAVRLGNKLPTKWFVAGAVALAISTWDPAITYLYQNKNIDKYVYTNSKAINSYIPNNSKVVSNNVDSMFTCFYNKLHCYGVFSPPPNNYQDAKVYGLLKSWQVQYFIYYGNINSDLLTHQFLNRHSVLIKKVIVINPGNVKSPIYIYKLA